MYVCIGSSLTTGMDGFSLCMDGCSPAWDVVIHHPSHGYIRLPSIILGHQLLKKAVENA
jgi:hypothetical protein